METNEKSRVLDMTRGNPFRLVLKFALPLFFGNLLQQFYNLADTAIAGHVLGDHALAQIGAVSALYGLITNFAFHSRPLPHKEQRIAVMVDKQFIQHILLLSIRAILEYPPHLAV